MNHLVNITKSDGTKQLFEEEKLRSSLKRVGASPEAIDEVVEEVERNMWEGMPSNEIYRHAFNLLRKHSHQIAVKYSVRRALMELGPEGFPFEQFVARIFRMWGYEAITDQTLLGRCVEHEVDVVAWKGTDLAMVEAKFHNQFGMKSDVKVVLYIKARFDDLSETIFEYGGVKRKLSDRYLFTNTKFTDQAVKYSECNGLKLVGWNYPDKGNLHELIEQNKLHPITCSMKLTHSQKRELVGKGILMCAELILRPGVLNEIGIHGDIAQSIIDEVKMIVGS